jgi:hypothetical protein
MHEDLYFLFLKRPTNPPGCIKVILLHRNHQHVSATYAANLTVVRQSEHTSDPHHIRALPTEQEEESC